MRFALHWIKAVASEMTNYQNIIVNNDTSRASGSFATKYKIHGNLMKYHCLLILFDRINIEQSVPEMPLSEHIFYKDPLRVYFVLK